MDLNVMRSLKRETDTKVVLLVMDGLGGLPDPKTGKTELEAAKTPNMDALAAESICGLHEPIGAGITPGSGPAHLGLFGYAPLEYTVGRGVLSAMGIDFDLKAGDVACRGNFCTVDDSGVITDRRAGRLSTEENRRIVKKLAEIEVPGVEVMVETIKEHRFLLVFRGSGLASNIKDTDPHIEGKKPLDPQPLDDRAKQTAQYAKQFLEKAQNVLADEKQANMALLRGFAEMPDWPSFEEVYGVRPASIAAYPMYRGLAKLLGMEALDAGEDPSEKFETLSKYWNDYDFFFIHVKKPDKTGEDGDFQGKVESIEKVDKAIPELRKLKPDVTMITGDHSTPWSMHSHGWQPVPVLINSDYCRPDTVTTFGERACLAGGLGPRIPAVDLMPLAMANAMRVDKFGA
jgi:2,3-bisphosphoglycerate-independent phosphoglycerate mutase